MKRIITMIAATAMLAVSCQKDLERGGNCTLTASIVQSKVTYNEVGNDLQPAWEIGDVVIGFDNAGNTYTLTVESVTEETAILKGSVPDGDLHLIYKKGANAGDIVDKTLQVNYGSQSGGKDMPAVMLSDGTVTKGSGSFVFTNTGAIIGIAAMNGVPAGSAIGSVKVKGKNLSAATVKLSGNTLAISSEGSGSEIATVALSGVSTLNAGGALSRTVFVAVPAGASISTVSASVGDRTYSYTLSSERTVENGQYLYVKTQTFEKEIVMPEGALSGLFSISASKKVYFSKGNLQYCASDKKWQFAANQYDVIGNAPGNNVKGDENRAKQTDWIDLFGWGATGLTDINSYLAAPYLTSTKSNSNTLFKTQATPSKDEKLTRENGGDWGVCMGNGWRTLSKEEWAYLTDYKFPNGEDYSNAKRAGKFKNEVTVCGVEGCLVLAPDDFNGTIASSYDKTTWSAAEAAGLVCLPIGGSRNGYGEVVLLTEAKYWLSTLNSLANAHYAHFTKGTVNINGQSRYFGFSVRLVLDESAVQ